MSPLLVGCHNYSEANSGWPDINLELITKAMNDLAQEIGTMEPDDPKQTPFLKELSVLTQLRRSLKFAGEPRID